MKKILLIIAFCILWSSQIFAAGSCVENTSDSYNGSDMRWKSYTCTADASDGTIANTTITGFKGYYLYTVETWPGATAPTDDSDYTVLDATKSVTDDLMGGNGTDGIDATDPETHLPKSLAAGLNLYHLIKGNLTLAISGNSVHSAIIYVRITGVK